jgi:hypothetical protein
MATNFLDLILGTSSLVEGQEKERRLCCEWLGTELIEKLLNVVIPGPILTCLLH